MKNIFIFWLLVLSFEVLPNIEARANEIEIKCSDNKYIIEFIIVSDRIHDRQAFFIVRRVEDLLIRGDNSLETFGFYRKSDGKLYFKIDDPKNQDKMKWKYEPERDWPKTSNIIEEWAKHLGCTFPSYMMSNIISKLPLFREGRFESFKTYKKLTLNTGSRNFDTFINLSNIHIKKEYEKILKENIVKEEIMKEESEEKDTERQPEQKKQTDNLQIKKTEKNIIEKIEHLADKTNWIIYFIVPALLVSLLLNIFFFVTRKINPYNYFKLNRSAGEAEPDNENLLLSASAPSDGSQNFISALLRKCKLLLGHNEGCDTRRQQHDVDFDKAVGVYLALKQALAQNKKTSQDKIKHFLDGLNDIIKLMDDEKVSHDVPGEIRNKLNVAFIIRQELNSLSEHPDFNKESEDEIINSLKEKYNEYENVLNLLTIDEDLNEFARQQPLSKADTLSQKAYLLIKLMTTVKENIKKSLRKDSPGAEHESPQVRHPGNTDLFSLANQACEELAQKNIIENTVENFLKSSSVSFKNILLKEKIKSICDSHLNLEKYGSHLNPEKENILSEKRKELSELILNYIGYPFSSDELNDEKYLEGLNRTITLELTQLEPRHTRLGLSAISSYMEYIIKELENRERDDITEGLKLKKIRDDIEHLAKNVQGELWQEKDVQNKNRRLNSLFRAENVLRGYDLENKNPELFFQLSKIISEVCAVIRTGMSSFGIKDIPVPVLENRPETMSDTGFNSNLSEIAEIFDCVKEAEKIQESKLFVVDVEYVPFEDSMGNSLIEGEVSLYNFSDWTNRPDKKKTEINKNQMQQPQ